MLDAGPVSGGASSRQCLFLARTAMEPVERLVRAPLLLLDGGVLLRIDRLAARRDGGGEGDGLDRLAPVLEPREITTPNAPPLPFRY